MRRLVLFFLLLFASLDAFSQAVDLSRAERVAKAAGLEDLLAIIQANNIASAKGQAQSLLGQLQQAGLPDSAVKELAPRITEMFRKVTQAWDPKVAARIYAEGLSASLTDAELGQAELYYSSPEGKKTYAAIADSERKMQEYVVGKTTEVLQAEMGGFMEAFKKAAAEARKR